MIYIKYKEAIAVALQDIERQLLKINDGSDDVCAALRAARIEILEHLEHIPKSEAGDVGCDSPGKWQFAINLTL